MKNIFNIVFVCGIIGMAILLVLLIYPDIKRYIDISAKKKELIKSTKDTIKQNSIDGNKQKSFIISRARDTLAPVVQKLSGARSGRPLRKSEEKVYAEISAMLYSANINMSAYTFQFIRNVSTVIGILIALFIALNVPLIAKSLQFKALIIVLGMATPYLGFKYWLKAKIKKRQEAVIHQLPDALDLLYISVDAGMHFNQAMEYTSQAMTGPFAEELSVASQEMSVGATREKALKELAERTKNDDVSGFVSAVLQATENGWPLATTLKVQSDSVREARKANAEQRAAKASIKMLLPMVSLIFPALFIVLLAPAMMNIMSSGVLG